MATVYRRTYTRPVPAGAEIFVRKVRGEQQRFARFKDRKGRTKTLPLSDDGKKVVAERRCWYIAYVDADGVRRTEKGYTDRDATEQKARDLEKQAARQRAGLQVIDADKVHTPISQVLDAYLEDLERLGRDETYRYVIRKLVEKLQAECGWTTLAHIRVDALTAWLAEARRSGLSARTLNAYLDTPRTFLAWCVQQRYLEANPLLNLAKADVNIDRRRVRRALTAEELGKLLEVAGPRRLCYLTAMLTGLRRKELRQLQWGDVHLEGGHPQVALRAKATKAKREDVLPLPSELVEALVEVRPANAGATSLVFASVPVLRTFKRDLEKAGISYKDGAGRQADFHALRVSFNMLLAKQQVPIRTAMRLMRHSDIRLTTKVYTDPTLLDLGGAVETLPRIGAPKTPPGGDQSATA